MSFRLGKAGEDAVRAAYNIGSKSLVRINGRFRIPDGVNTAERTVSEIKNVASQSYTRQLRDYVDYAKSRNFQFILYVRSDTRLSGPLEAAIAAKEIVLRQIP